jgi:hypothetical protein
MELAPLAQHCLHTMKQQARCKITAHLHSSQTFSTRPISHFPTRRRKTCASKFISSNRTFSTSRHVLQGPPSSQLQPASQHSAQPPSTAPKPSIMTNLIGNLGLQSSDYIPKKQPMATQLSIFDDPMKNDILIAMGSDPKRRPRRSALSREDDGIDQHALYANLNSTAYRQSEAPKVNLRLKPALGRTVPLDLTRNIDLTSAFRRVERKCTQNNVKVDARNQKFHVRRGQRRKDDRRRRWRALFKEGFLHECARIRRMKAQGW